MVEEKNFLTNYKSFDNENSNMGHKVRTLFIKKVAHYTLFSGVYFLV